MLYRISVYTERVEWSQEFLLPYVWKPNSEIIEEVQQTCKHSTL